MSDIDDILSQLPIGDIAAKLGVDETTAKAAAADALPALLAGLGANASDPAGAASLEKALAKHDNSLLTGGVNLADVDEEDGKKIVKNVFGDNTDKVVGVIDQKAGGGVGDIVGKLLPILAPIVLSFLASKFFGGKNDTAQAEAGAAAGGSGGGIGDLLGGLLGGGGGAAAGGSGGGLGGLLGGLGGLLGGGGESGAGASGGGLGDLLGGLLGGGKR